MMLASQWITVPLLPDGSGQNATWNRRVQIFTNTVAADLQDEMNAFLEDLGVNPDYDLGAAVLSIQVIEDGATLVGTIDYGFFD